MASFAYLFERFPSFTQTFCYREVREMVRHGADPAIFSIRKPEDIPADCPPELAQAVTYLPEDPVLRAGIKAELEAGTLKGKPAKDLVAWGKRGDKSRLYEAIWLGRELRRRGVRHVHTHFSGIAARTAYWLKAFYGITYSFTGHANDMFCANDHPVTLEDLLREAEFAAVVSDFSRAWLCGQHPAWAGKIHRVYNGIDLAPFQPAQPAPGALPRIVSVGRCIEKKGFPVLIDACALLKARGIAFECQIVGSGPLESEYRAKVATLGLEREVHLTGAQPQEVVRELLGGATLFALACAEEADGGMDNLPTVIAEAMAFSLPVVSTRLAGVPEMVEHGQSGLLVAPGSPGELADALQTLLADPQKARRLGEAGRALAEARFASEVTGGELRALLGQCKGVRFPWQKRSFGSRLLEAVGLQ